MFKVRFVTFKTKHQTVQQIWFYFFVACSMALNSSTVLFIGLSNASDPELSPTSSNFFDYNVKQWSFVKNDITATYNFDDNTWTQHESLNYPQYLTIQGVAIGLRYGYEVLCSSYHDKHESKILTISFMVDHYEHFARKYHPFAWISSFHSISWLPLENDLFLHQSFQNTKMFIII